MRMLPTMRRKQGASEQAPALSGESRNAHRAMRSWRLMASRRVRQLIGIAAVVVDAFLGLHFAVFATGAVIGARLMNALSQVATTLDAPFRGLVIAGRAAGHPLLWEDVIAIGVYTVAAWLVSRLILGAIAGRRQRAALA